MSFPFRVFVSHGRCGHRQQENDIHKKYYFIFTVGYKHVKRQMKMVWGGWGRKEARDVSFFSVKGAHVITLSYEQIAYELYVELKRSFVPILMACFILSGSLSLSISHAIFIHFFTWHYLIRVPFLQMPECCCTTGGLFHI